MIVTAKGMEELQANVTMLHETITALDRLAATRQRRIAELEAENARVRAERDEQRDFWRSFYRNLAHYRAVAPAQAPGFPAQALRFSRWDTPR